MTTPPPYYQGPTPFSPPQYVGYPSGYDLRYGSFDPARMFDAAPLGAPGYPGAFGWSRGAGPGWCCRACCHSCCRQG